VQATVLQTIVIQQIGLDKLEYHPSNGENDFGDGGVVVVLDIADSLDDVKL
jgi:hypothetical protein